MENRNNTILTKEERDVLILGSMHPSGKQLDNAEIGQHLGLPVSRVKTLIRQACIKLEAHNRNEAINFALRKGEIRANEIYSIDEIVERLSSLGPEVWRRVSQLVQRMRVGENLREIFEEIGEFNNNIGRRQNALLTESERNVMILAGNGFSNKEIANRLYISTNAVKTYLYRACTKLGTRRRAEAVMLALRKGEIGVFDIFSPYELIKALSFIEPEYIEQVSQLLYENFGRKSVQLGFYFSPE